MASKPVRLHPEAEREYLEALAWYRDRSVGVASDFDLAVSKAVHANRSGSSALAELLRRIQAVHLASVSVQHRVSGNVFRGRCFRSRSWPASASVLEKTVRSLSSSRWTRS